MNRSLLFKLLRVLVAAGLLCFLLHRIGLESLSLVLETRYPLYFALFIPLILLDALTRSWNWGVLLGTRGHKLPIREMLFNYLAGAFFGTFIPSSLGTVVSQAVMVSRRNGIGARDSALAMLVLNMINLLTLSLIGLASASLLLGMLDDPRLPAAIIAVCIAYLLFFPLLLSGRIPFKFFNGSAKLTRLTDKLMEFSAALAAFKEHRGALMRVLMITFLNQAIAIMIVYTAARALAIDAPLLFFVAVVPVITLSRLIPISIAGLGGEQGVFVLLFAYAGVSGAEAFLLSLIVSFAGLGLALFGGCMYILDGLGHVSKDGDKQGGATKQGSGVSGSKEEITAGSI